jgi:hypothetical protein
MLVAIHQPNFLPWLGYFDKLAQADVFVLLDNVPLQRTGGNYTNRVEMLISGKRAWVTVPIARAAETRERISEARIVDSGPWRRKVCAAVEQSYAHAPCFAEAMPLVRSLLDHAGDRLAEFNTAALRRLAAAVGLDPRRMIVASELRVSGAGTDLLVAIVRAAGGDAYLCGAGAGLYQEDEKFAAAGIELRYQNFRHPIYPQVNTPEFMPGLSIVDALMNCGAAGVVDLLAPATSRKPAQARGEDRALP